MHSKIHLPDSDSPKTAHISLHSKSRLICVTFKMNERAVEYVDIGVKLITIKRFVQYLCFGSVHLNESNCHTTMMKEIVANLAYDYRVTIN